MKNYSIPTIDTPIDPILNNWVNTIPPHLRERTTLMDFLMRVSHGIYDGNGIKRDSHTNPFYKFLELLKKDKLVYKDLKTINEYYHIDIISYLTKGNRGEFYLGYPCNNVSQLRKALDEKNNITDKDTLANILSNMV